MGTLRYMAMCSVDGYTAGPDGTFGFAMPSLEVHAAVNAAEREVGTAVYGRRMWETMTYWATDDPMGPDEPAESREYAEIWRAQRKIVLSDTLGAVDVPNTRVEPRAGAARVAAIVAETDGVVEIGGPTVAAEALRAGLVDEVHLYVVPHVVGGGLRALPDGAALDWRLVGSRTFANGTVFLRYAGQ
jgi:dihydrofolate reductase